VQIIHHALVESALLFQRAAFGQRQPYKDYVLASADAEEIRIVDEIGLVVLCDHLFR